MEWEGDPRRKGRGAASAAAPPPPELAPDGSFPAPLRFSKAHWKAMESAKQRRQQRTEAQVRSIRAQQQHTNEACPGVLPEGTQERGPAAWTPESQQSEEGPNMLAAERLGDGGGGGGVEQGAREVEEDMEVEVEMGREQVLAQEALEVEEALEVQEEGEGDSPASARLAPRLMVQIHRKLRAAAYTMGGVDMRSLFQFYDRDNSGPCHPPPCTLPLSCLWNLPGFPVLASGVRRAQSWRSPRLMRARCAARA